jgi:hypothetical protein
MGYMDLVPVKFQREWENVVRRLKDADNAA